MNGPPRAGLRRRLPQRGFTLIELMVVVILVAIFASVAIPQITQQMRDRRVRETAQRIANMYRSARLRALGQGSAVLVSYRTGTNGQGALTVREALVGISADQAVAGNECTLLPSPSCLNTDWVNGAETVDFRTIAGFEIAVDEGLAGVFFTMTTPPPTPGVVGTFHVCYTPIGRVFTTAAAAPDPTGFTPMRGVAVGEVYRSATGGSGAIGLRRTVLIMPNGTSRLQL